MCRHEQLAVGDQFRFFLPSTSTYLKRVLLLQSVCSPYSSAAQKLIGHPSFLPVLSVYGIKRVLAAWKVNSKRIKEGGNMGGARMLAGRQFAVLQTGRDAKALHLKHGLLKVGTKQHWGWPPRPSRQFPGSAPSNETGCHDAATRTHLRFCSSFETPNIAYACGFMDTKILIWNSVLYIDS